jgi:hypothetical protein
VSNPEPAQRKAHSRRLLALAALILVALGLTLASAASARAIPLAQSTMTGSTRYASKT